jgi:putative transposase
VVSGRGMRSLKRCHNKALGQLDKKRKRCQKGSRRWRKLQSARRNVSARKRRQVRDLRHKGTRKVITFCQQQGVSILFIGNPHGVRNKNNGRHHNQRMAQWEYGQDIAYLSYKAKLAGIESSLVLSGVRAASVLYAAGNKKSKGVCGAAAIPSVSLKDIGMWLAALICTLWRLARRYLSPRRLTYQRAGPVRALTRSEQPGQMLGSQPVVVARTRATRRA